MTRAAANKTGPEVAARAAGALEDSDGLRVPTLSCLIVTTPRSGSWLLSSGLHDTELAGQPEEYFRPDVIPVWTAEWGIPRRGPYREYVRHAMDYSTSDNGVFGAKLHWYQYQWLIRTMRALEGGAGTALGGQSDPRADLDFLATFIPNPRFVHLVRRDKIRQAMSYFRAGRTGVWFVTEEDVADMARRPQGPQPAPRPLSDREWQHLRFLENLVIAHERNWRNFFDETGIEPLEIIYEEFIEDFNGTVGAVLEFLGVGTRADAASLSPRLFKQGDEVSEAWVEEYLVRRDSIEPKPMQRPRRPGVVR
jgi:LPS sulfotransferase NodH